jgi:hypothetical protein
MVMRKNILTRWIVFGASVGLLAQGWGASNVYLTEVPDYGWWAGCYGTASGNLMGFWDRHGFPDFYTGPTNGGQAPLNNYGANAGIISLWASQAGVDGRPAGQFGHYDDYYADYESTDPDPFTTAGRQEHAADCIGDFIGLSQWKWTDMAGECNGNLDGFSFNYWDSSGDKRVNYTPSAEAGMPARDIQSGLRAWAQYRGSESEVFSQLADFNPNTPSGHGFTFADLKAEIDAGYPVLLFLQNYDEISRNIGSLTRVNPEMHGMLAYGYYETDDGSQYVRYRTSWASGDNRLHTWDAQPWEAGISLRGLIGFHPTPKIRHFSLSGSNLTLQWEGPSSEIYDVVTREKRLVHGYVVEMSNSLSLPQFEPVSPVILGDTYTLTNCPSSAYYRIKLVRP